MKFLSPCLASYVAIASITCLLSSSAVADDAIANPNTDFNAEVRDFNTEVPDFNAEVPDQGFESLDYGGKKGHHHHSKKRKHHHKLKPRPTEKRVLNLVCDKIIIDKLVCKVKRPPIVCGDPAAESVEEGCQAPPLAESIAEEGQTPPLAESIAEEGQTPPLVESVAEEPQTPFEALNNGGAQVTQVFIVMDSPCSKIPPLPCSTAPEIAGDESEDPQGTASDTITDDDTDAVTNDDTDTVTDDDTDTVTDDETDTDTDDDTDADNVNLWNKKHHHHQRRRKGKHHRQHHHKKRKHPWEDLCVAVGEFCGSKLYGCSFDPKTLYSCKAVGERPVVALRDAKVCGGTDEGKCRCSSTTPVCGSQVPSDCVADPSAIYYCPKGKYEIFQVCPPGSLCRTPPYAEPICGFSSCDCTGTDKVCSQQFPEKCKLKKNAVYKCTDNGKPDLVYPCNDDKICISVSNGAFCGNKDCKCPRDGELCGENFPASCRFPATGLYNCKTGQYPTLIKICVLPNRCTAIIAVTAASAVFEDAAAKDSCSDACKCISKGKVCGSTFLTLCRWDKTALYTCDGFGSIPVKAETCDKGCIVHGGDDSCDDNCKCPISRDGKPVCGGKLDPDCKADPTAIYHCPYGEGSRPQILKKCPPGTQCNTDKDGDSNCGYENCQCAGDGKYCSQQFPGKCDLVANSVYKCKYGKLDLDKTCDRTEECVATADGAMCTSKDCKCPRDGIICGDIFPLACRLTASTLYKCKRGEKPEEYKKCEPGTCTSSRAKLDADPAFVPNDQCIYDCKCLTDGK
ncbi:hypothetical protein BGZ82_009561, partial [Podila clonocystis]